MGSLNQKKYKIKEVIILNLNYFKIFYKTVTIRNKRNNFYLPILKENQQKDDSVDFF